MGRAMLGKVHSPAVKIAEMMTGAKTKSTKASRASDPHGVIFLNARNGGNPIKLLKSPKIRKIIGEMIIATEASVECSLMAPSTRRATAANVTDNTATRNAPTPMGFVTAV
jgi:hypothetical protein